MNLAIWLKFAHIVDALIWIGGGVMLSLIWDRGETNRRSPSRSSHVVAHPTVDITRAWSIRPCIRDRRSVSESHCSGARQSHLRMHFDVKAARDLLSRWIVSYEIVLLVPRFPVWIAGYDHQT